MNMMNESTFYAIADYFVDDVDAKTSVKPMELEITQILMNSNNNNTCHRIHSSYLQTFMYANAKFKITH